MKTKLFLLMSTAFFAIQLFAQVKTVKPLTQKTVETTPTTNKITTPKPVKTENSPPKPTDLQSAVINIVVGDDGKDDDTKFDVIINDDNKRPAAYYGYTYNDRNKGAVIGPITKGEFYPGDNEALEATLDASVPTGDVTMKGNLPLAALREANLSDFGNGGSVHLDIIPFGHDTWKIKTISVTLYFNNDSHSPHRITWSGITLSQDGGTRDLLFDKSFNPIQ